MLKSGELPKGGSDWASTHQWRDIYILLLECPHHASINKRRSRLPAEKQAVQAAMPLFHINECNREAIQRQDCFFHLYDIYEPPHSTVRANHHGL